MSKTTLKLIIRTEGKERCVLALSHGEGAWDSQTPGPRLSLHGIGVNDGSGYLYLTERGEPIGIGTSQEVILRVEVEP